MSGAPFRAIGGAVVTDHGAITLKQARELAKFYAREADALPRASPARGLCDARAGALGRAAQEALLWRRAAGWSDPEAADPMHP